MVLMDRAMIYKISTRKVKSINDMRSKLISDFCCPHAVSSESSLNTYVCLQALLCPNSNNIFKTKSKWTLFITEYFYSCFGLIKMKYFICFPRLGPTKFTRGHSCKLFHYRVTCICTFIKKTRLSSFLILK